MPQRRKRTYIVGYLEDSAIWKQIKSLKDWVNIDGVLASAFPFEPKPDTISEFEIEGSIKDISDNFNKEGKESPYGSAGIIRNRKVYTIDCSPVYDGTRMTLGGNIVDEECVPDEYFIPEEEVKKWEYEKGAKRFNRVAKNGHEYVYSEGAMAFPDYINRPSRTIITGEGGSSPSRFKHVIKTKSGRYRRLIPLELERLNMFPDNHTYHPDVSDSRRAFLMGNALVCGIVERIGKSLYEFIYGEAPLSTKPLTLQRDATPRLELAMFSSATGYIVANTKKKTYALDPNKHLFIGFVKADNEEYFTNLTDAKIYYTGKTKSFPSTVALNKLYYFMPYIKGKGVRDLYLIRIARIGTKAEVHPECNDTDPRLVFELEYLESLPEYKPVDLKIFNTYRDSLLSLIFPNLSSQ